MKYSVWIAGIIWLVSMTILFSVPRDNFITLWSFYSIAFAGYFWMVFRQDGPGLWPGLALALGIRLLAFFFDPQLTDDYYRFLWDGMVTSYGVNPISLTPAAFISAQPGIDPGAHFLFTQLNSHDYYSVYPPIAQGIFALLYKVHGLHIAGFISNLRGLLLCVDVIIVYLIGLILRRNNIPIHRVFIFALNPLVILEFTGNLHMDGIMIAGVLGALYCIQHGKNQSGVILMAVSVLSKMTSFILLPFIFKTASWRRYLNSILLCSLLIGITFWVSFGHHAGWLESIRLWFQTFEFNAGLYFLFRELGEWVTGYNAIAIIGPGLGILGVAILFLIWWKYAIRRSLDGYTSMVIALTVFYGFSTTIHPWYIILPLVLCIFSKHVFPVIWTYLVFLSYSHYAGGRFEENYCLLAAEYVLLAGFMIAEWKLKSNPANSFP